MSPLGHPLKINFFIVEQSMAVIARQLFLLALAWEPTSALGLGDKAAMFLEVYGDIMIRSKTSDYVKAMATKLIKLVSMSMCE